MSDFPDPWPDPTDPVSVDAAALIDARDGDLEAESPPVQPIEAVIAAFLNYLENGGPEPSLDHLAEDERSEATELTDLIKDARGVDFYRSRPSLDTLLAGTEWEGIR